MHNIHTHSKHTFPGKLYRNSITQKIKKKHARYVYNM